MSWFKLDGRTWASLAYLVSLIYMTAAAGVALINAFLIFTVPWLWLAYTPFPICLIYVTLVYPEIDRRLRKDGGRSEDSK